MQIADYSSVVHRCDIITSFWLFFLSRIYLRVFKMSDNLSVEEVSRKLKEGIFLTTEKESGKNELWKLFRGIIGEDKKELHLFVICVRCNKILSYDSRKGGTSHLRRHADSCKGASTSGISQKMPTFFRANAIPLSVKQNVSRACVDFVCQDIRPFEIVAGAGFEKLAQALISVGAKYGNVPASDVLSHPTTIARHCSEKVEEIKRDVVLPEIKSYLNKWGGAVTTDMWTETRTLTSYITVTAHYITDEWILKDRVLATREFDSDMRHTGVNIQNVLIAILAEFDITANNVVFVTDRGANMLAALRNFVHISCCDHMLNTVQSHLFNPDKMDEIPEVRALMTASKDLVRFFKKAPGLMKHLKTTLKQEVSTRWNTMFTMLDSVYENYAEVEHILDARNETYRLANIDKTLLGKLVDFLRLFKEASDELEATKTPTLQKAVSLVS